MKAWLMRFLDEKGVDLEEVFEIESNGPFGNNFIPLGCVVEAILSAPANEQKGIKSMLVKLDFMNKNVVDYFKHLAKAIAV